MTDEARMVVRMIRDTERYLMQLKMMFNRLAIKEGDRDDPRDYGWTEEALDVMESTR